jgi:hypothetical protein
MKFIKLNSASIDGVVSDKPFIVNIENVDYAFPYTYPSGKAYVRIIVNGTQIEFAETEEQSWEKLYDSIKTHQNRTEVIAVTPADGWGFTVRGR